MPINENQCTQNWAYYQLSLFIPQAAIHESDGLRYHLTNKTPFN